MLASGYDIEIFVVEYLNIGSRHLRFLARYIGDCPCSHHTRPAMAGADRSCRASGGRQPPGRVTDKCLASEPDKESIEIYNTTKRLTNLQHSPLILSPIN